MTKVDVIGLRRTAAAGTLETASLAVKAVWLICVMVLAVIVVGILAGLLAAVF